MKRFTTLLGSTAIAAMMLTAPAANAMHDELTMLEAAVKADLNTIGMSEVDINMLTVGQLAQIKAVLDGDEAKMSSVEAIIDANATYVYPRTFAEVEFDGGSSLEQVIANDLATLDVEANVELLTVTELSQIKNVLSSDEPSSDKKRRIEAIIAD